MVKRLTKLRREHSQRERRRMAFAMVVLFALIVITFNIVVAFATSNDATYVSNPPPYVRYTSIFGLNFYEIHEKQ